jgi:DNA-binding CsgD family transcriptional regulator
MSAYEFRGQELEALVKRSPPPIEWRPCDLASLWLELTSGTARLAGILYTESHCFGRVVTRSDGVALSGRGLDVLERILSGTAQKAIAIEDDMSFSAVATTAAESLRYLGLDCSVRNVPLLVVAAVYARYTSAARPGLARWVEADKERYRIVGLLRPECRLRQQLTWSEYSVAALKTQGASAAAIAAMRNTSPRTVANQVAATYRKLHVSSRVELMWTALGAT